MTDNKTNTFDFGQLILGILYAIAAFIALRNPAASLVSLVVIGGVVALVRGISTIILRNKAKDKTNQGFGILIFIGVVYIIIGLLILTNIATSLAILPFVFGAWFIIDGINDLFLSASHKALSGGMKAFSIIASIIFIVLGFLVIANPLSAYFTLTFLVGFYFLIAAIRNIVGAFI